MVEVANLSIKASKHKAESTRGSQRLRLERGAEFKEQVLNKGLAAVRQRRGGVGGTGGASGLPRFSRNLQPVLGSGFVWSARCSRLKGTVKIFN